jgi:hypothetical protein
VGLALSLVKNVGSFFQALRNRHRAGGSAIL